MCPKNFTVSALAVEGDARAGKIQRVAVGRRHDLHLIGGSRTFRRNRRGEGTHLYRSVKERPYELLDDGGVQRGLVALYVHDDGVGLDAEL